MSQSAPAGLPAFLCSSLLDKKRIKNGNQLCALILIRRKFPLQIIVLRNVVFAYPQS